MTNYLVSRPEKRPFFFKTIVFIAPTQPLMLSQRQPLVPMRKGENKENAAVNPPLTAIHNTITPKKLPDVTKVCVFLRERKCLFARADVDLRSRLSSHR